MYHGDDESWMRRALQLAERAATAGQVPVGAVVVRDGEAVGEGWNRPVQATDPTGHAEIIALRAAGRRLRNYRLPGCILYVTVEPCAMCAGALVHARIARLVFGTREPRAGAVASRLQLLDQEHLNHRVPWEEGLLAQRAAGLMRDFFRLRRRDARDARHTGGPAALGLDCSGAPT